MSNATASPFAALSLPPLTPESAAPAAAAVLSAAQSRMGMIPNMYQYMAQLPGLLSTYAHGYESFRSEGGFSPAEQEVVLLVISRENACEYCVAAHSFLAAGPSGVPRDVVHALRLGGDGTDTRLAALAKFTRAMVRERGRPSADSLAEFIGAGYSERQAMAVLLAISVKTISNYANHLFNTPLDEPFRGWTWEAGASAAAVVSAA